MPSPIPKPRGTQRKKGPPRGHELPAGGRAGPAPALPVKKPTWLKSTREWWATVWASPMATVYTAADVPSLVRLARFIELDVRGEADSTTRSEIRQLEDRFGLSPLARRRLQWEIKAAEAERASTPSRRRHLRAVDAAV